MVVLDPISWLCKYSQAARQCVCAWFDSKENYFQLCNKCVIIVERFNVQKMYSKQRSLLLKTIRLPPSSDKTLSQLCWCKRCALHIHASSRGTRGSIHTMMRHQIHEANLCTERLEQISESILHIGRLTRNFKGLSLLRSTTFPAAKARACNRQPRVKWDGSAYLMARFYAQLAAQEG